MSLHPPISSAVRNSLVDESLRRGAESLTAPRSAAHARGIWHPINIAPSQTTLIVWGGAGGLRFARKDNLGQWRSMMGQPKAEPKFWMQLPEPPRT